MGRLSILAMLLLLLCMEAGCKCAYKVLDGGKP